MCEFLNYIKIFCICIVIYIFLCELVLYRNATYNIIYNPQNIKTANTFLHYALQNEDEFNLKSKFPIINEFEKKINPIWIFPFSCQMDYKKLSSEVWKHGNIQTDIKSIFKTWNEKKNVN